MNLKEIVINAGVGYSKVEESINDFSEKLTSLLSSRTRTELAYRPHAH